jgi:pimeloyl-ACP methyl ester carboxylesterase
MNETHERPAATRQLTTGTMPAQATLQDDHTEAEDALGREVAGCVEPAGRPVTDAAAGGGVHATVGPVRRLMAAVVIVALAVVVVTALGSGPAGAAGTSSSAPAIAWHHCPANSEASMVGGFLCASVAAPLDYRDPSGTKIKLAVVEHQATGPRRRGVLFVNPGGPGLPGTEAIPAELSFFPKELLRDHDIVSWDPRGVGGSTAVQCFTSQAAENAFLGKYISFPVGQAQQHAYIAKWREYGKICGDRDGALLKYLSTANTARDLNLLRQALGQARLDYLGLSYGTLLGATYANLFPRRVRRMVLDGNATPKALGSSLSVGVATATANDFDAFLRLCGQHNTQACVFSAGSPAATEANWKTFLARVNRAPINVGDTTFNYAAVLNLVSGDAIESVSAWPALASDLQQGWLASSPNASAPPATTSAVTALKTRRCEGNEQRLAILCADSPGPPVGAYPRLQHLLLKSGGAVGMPDLWGEEPCATWPVHQVGSYHGPWNAPTKPILVINNTHDAATPFQNAIAMTHDLADARLLAVKGYGHTAFLNPSTCADNYMTSYFLTGALPAKGTVCRQNLTPFAPAGPSTR